MSKRCQRFREWFLYQLLTPLRLIFEWWMQRQNLVLLYCIMGNGLGDAMAISTILNAMHKKFGTKGIVFSMQPDLFLHNPQVIKNLSYKAMPNGVRSLFKIVLRALRGPAVICIGGEVWTVGTNPFDTRDLHKQRKKGWSWLEMLVPDFRPEINFKEISPIVFFSADEVERFNKNTQNIPRPFVVLKASVGVNRPAGNYLKNWDKAKIVEMVARFPNVFWIQIGDAGEELVPGAMDLLGQTSLRESMWLVTQAKFIFSVEGFLTHVANAFNIPAITPLTGAYDPSTFIYKNTIPLIANPMPECSPCWKNHCEVVGMPCRSRIDIEQAIRAVEMLSREKI